MRQFETRNISIETVASALRPYHRHGDEDSAYDALCIELADLSTNTLAALQAALVTPDQGKMTGSLAFDKKD